MLAGSSALAALIILIALVLRGGTAQGSPGIISIGHAAPITPRPAPDFVVTTFEGHRIQLSDLRGQIVILNFWAAWCPPCRIEAPVLERASNRLSAQGVTILGIDIWDDKDAATTFLNELGISYLNAEDTSRLIPVEYGLTGLPETFVIDRRGVLVKRWVGPLTDVQIDDLLAPLLSKNPT